MKKLELKLTIRSGDSIKSIELVEADDYLELLTKINMVLLRNQRKESEEEINDLKWSNDDIPF